GERLDLDHAIYVCLANAGLRARQRDQAQRPESTDQQPADQQPADQQRPDPQDQPEPFQPSPWGVNPFAWTAAKNYEYRTSAPGQPGPGDEAGAADRREGPSRARVSNTG
ncbi:MAG TPA: hypothetical protein VME19_22010, partial [Streptosporangiaceae bacterium]|nr:hypothetical protein [Streptosporangiaceae bacterium]